jgi:hydroxysqualene dehydroxylase
VRFTQRAEERADIQKGRRASEERLEADAVVAAVPWHVLPGLLPENVRSTPPFAGLADIRSSPIVSVELWLDRVVVGPPLVGLRDSEVEWVFDKGRLFGRPGAPQHLSFIVSAAYRSSPKRNAELLAAAVAALRRYFPAMAGATVTRSLVMREPEATFSAGPETEILRPPAVTPIEGLLLAGDWTATGLPATIEGAVRSGREAARVVQSSER